MMIRKRRYCAPTRDTRELAEGDLAEIRAAASWAAAVRVFRRLCMKQVGGVHASGNGWLAGMTIRKRQYRAPTRETRDLAEADLAEIRASASKNDAIRVVRRLKESCVKVGGVHANGNGWRAGMTRRKRRYYAPTRATPDLAHADLAEIRAAASWHAAVGVLRRLLNSGVK